MPLADMLPWTANYWKNAIGVNPERSNARNLSNRFGTIGGVAGGPVGTAAGMALGGLVGWIKDRGAAKAERLEIQDARNSAAIERNPMPANMWDNSAPIYPQAPARNPNPYDNNGPYVSQGAFDQFNQSFLSRLQKETADADAQITLDTINGNYVRRLPQAAAASSPYYGPMGNSTSQGAFSYLTGAAQGTRDVGGVLASLGDLGANDGYGNRNYVGQSALRQSLREAESSGDKSQIEWAQNMRQQIRDTRQFGSNR